MCDKDGHKIEATFWADAVDKFENILQEDKVYEFSGGYFKDVNRKYAQVDHPFTLTFDVHSTITEIDEQIETKFNLKTIDDINDPNGAIDILVKVISHSPIQEINTKYGTKKIKRLKVADISKTSIELALWSESAEMMEGKSTELDSNCIIALMNAS